MLWFCHGSALAQAPLDSLDWVRDQGAESCIGGAQLGERVRALLPDEGGVWDTRRSVEGLVKRDPRTRHWLARIRVFDRAGVVLGERTLESAAADCASLDRPLMLVIALALSATELDPALPAALSSELTLDTEPGVLLLRELPAAPVVPMPSPAPPAAAPAPVTPAIRERTKRIELHTELSLAVAQASSRLQRDRPGLRVAARVILPWRLGVDVALHYWSPGSVESDLGSARFQALDAALSGCVAAFDRSRVRLGACAGGTWGARFGEASGLSVSRDTRRGYWGPSALVDVQVRIARRGFASLAGSVAALWPRDRFVYTDPSERRFSIYRPTRFSGWAALGGGVRF